MRSEFAAHTPSDATGHWHSLKEHLEDVSEKTEYFSNKLNAGPLGKTIGLWHDLGKFNPEFQIYLDQCHRASQQGEKYRGEKTPHAVYGALLAWEQFQLTPLAPIIWGHHAGLPQRAALKSKLSNPDLQSLQTEVLGNAKRTLETLQPSVDLTKMVATLVALEYEVLTRLLFSCLIDADHLDTEEHFTPEKTLSRQTQSITVPELWTKLKVDQDRLIKSVQAQKGNVNQVRQEVYKYCLESAQLDPGVFRLAVPTGGGKTRSGLAFGLKHAVEWGCDRVIIAVPYTSIIEQTVSVYREIFGEDAVLEHHSAVNDDTILQQDQSNDNAQQKFAQARLATQNWDAPLIVTTTVQLFESLFSNRPSKCRKLHNIVNSVIILDEVQTLPIGSLEPIVSMLSELCDRYHVTVVLCTATQPALTGETPYLKGFKQVRDIIPPAIAHQHFSQLKRVEYHIEPIPWSWSQLADDVNQHTSALVILNSRKNALDALDAISDFEKEKYIFHLSTLLCGKHRKKVLRQVRERLRSNQPCFLISTQVVEAGVDLDFPAVYRAIGPLDRIVQAAGRCNREGKKTKGQVVIFEPEEGKVPPGEYRAAFDETKLLLKQPNLDLHDPSIFEAYFARLYQKGTDANSIQELRQKQDFPEVARRFRLIRNDTTSVVVTYDNIVCDRIHAIQRRGLFASDYRALQPYIVNLRNYEFQQAKDLCEEIAPGLWVWGGSYHPVKGIGIGENAIAYDPNDLIV